MSEVDGHAVATPKMLAQKEFSSYQTRAVALWMRGAAIVLILVIMTSMGTAVLQEGPPKRLPSGIGKLCENRCAINDHLICVDNKCAYCETDEQCDQDRDGSFCNDEHLCRHKHMLPLWSEDIITAIIILITVAIASGGGIGGGGVLVSVYILVSRFSARDSIPLSNITIFGSSAYNVMHFVGMHHPYTERPRIDYDISIMLAPMSLAGTTIGVILNRVLPEWVILGLLFVVLGGMTFRTASIGVRLWRKEAARPAGENTPLLHHDDEPEVMSKRWEPLTPMESKLLAYMIRSDARLFPLDRIVTLAVLWLIVFAIALAKGGHGIGLVTCGSAAHWYLTFMVFPISIFITYMFGRYLLSIHERKLRLNYPFQLGDALWTERNVILYPALSTLAGVVAACLGVSGGLITGPLMLEWGVLPQVQSATTAFLVFFTASSSSVQFLIVSTIDHEYGFLFFVLGFCAAAIGQNIIGYLIHKYNMTSLIVFCTAIILGASVLLIGYIGIQYEVARVHLRHHVDSFHSMCR